MSKVSAWKIRLSLKIIRSSLQKYQPKLAVFWSGRPDSMVLLHLIKVASQDKITIPVMLISSALEPSVPYDFSERVRRQWQLSLLRISDRATERQYKQSKSRAKRQQLISKLKIRAVKRAVRKYRLNAIITGIRWEEAKAYQSEVYFSPFKKYMRIHPLLHFTKDDIENYLQEYHLPCPNNTKYHAKQSLKIGLLRRLLGRIK